MTKPISRHAISGLSRRVAGILALALLVAAVIATVGLQLASGGSEDAVVPKLPLPTIQLSASSQRVNENVGNATMTAHLSAASNDTATVAVVTRNGTALAGADYVTVTTTLVFPPGITTVSVAVPIIDEPTDEPDQTFTVVVRSPNNATLGTTTRAAITIVDDDIPPRVSWLIPGFFVDESIGTAPVTVFLDMSSDYPVTVQYATSDDTAIAGSDYTAKSGTATFAPGETYVKVNIPIVNDGISESEEHVRLTLSNPVYADLDVPNPSTLYITDAGTPPTPTTRPTS